MLRGWQPWLYAALIGAALAGFVEVHTNLSPDASPLRQAGRFNPDAELYTGLAENLAAGVGYYDTVRRREILPPVGHPLWLAAGARLFDGSPAFQVRTTVWLSVALLVLAVGIYCRSLLYALLALLLYGAYLRSIVWLAGNVEATIVLGQSLLLLGLAVFYRSGFAALSGVLAGAALAAGLLVRPMYLYLLHAATAIALAALARQALRLRRVPSAGLLRGSVALLLTAQLSLAAVSLLSHAEYGDSRLVSGTYSGYALYLGNSPHLEPRGVFRNRADQPAAFEAERETFRTWQTGWQARRAHYLGRVLDYWREQPLRALAGFGWRLQRFLGLHLEELPGRFARFEDARAAQRLWGPALHPLAVLALLGLLCVRFGQLVRRGDPAAPHGGLGLVLALLFATYVAMHSLFAFIGFRYVTGAVPVLVAAIPVLAYEAMSWRLHQSIPPSR